MARIQHIAFATNDPVETAEFYKRTFGLTELRRKPKDTGAEAVYLTDGLRPGGWDGHIRFKTQLYQLVPETQTVAPESPVSEAESS